MRRRIGLVSQEPTLDDRLTAEQNLRFHAVLYHVAAAEVEERIGRVLRLGRWRIAGMILCLRSPAAWPGGSPRWHDGRVWFSDWGAHRVIALDADSGALA